MKMIVGLGNPGVKYRGTRHNIGFEVVSALAQTQGWVFHDKDSICGRVAIGELEAQSCCLLLPATFMNDSGRAVKQCVEAYGVPLDQLIVVSDDVALPVGSIRLRTQGSAGGHNGLKSVQAHLGTSYYARLRIGIGESTEADLADYVLSRFLDCEQQAIGEVVKRGVDVLMLYVTQGVAAAMQKVNRKEI